MLEEYLKRNLFDQLEEVYKRLEDIKETLKYEIDYDYIPPFMERDLIDSNNKFRTDLNNDINKLTESVYSILGWQTIHPNKFKEE